MPGQLFAFGSFKLVVIALTVASCCFLIHAAPNSYSAAPPSFAISVDSPYASTFGSGNYSAGAVAAFGVTSTTVYNVARTVRYVFAGWSCSGSGCYSGSNSSAYVVMNDNMVENANWITQYLLSTSVSGNGSVSPEGQFWYDGGSSVKISESPIGAGWFFVYWSLDGQNAGSFPTYTVVMNSPHDVVAEYIKPKLESSLANVSDSYGDNLRNPDGTFYRLDEFEIRYQVIISGGSSLPTSVSFAFDITFPRTVVSELEKSTGHSTFIVLPEASPAPYNVTVTASILNSVDKSNRSLPIHTSEPFTVVNYSPHFTCFTYMDYNARNSSAYERPFIVLLRYDGNSPGYGYSGNINTNAFNALNATNERAMINNFTFTTEGWSILTNVSGANDSTDMIGSVNHTDLNLSVESQNQTARPLVLTWSNRVQKLYFSSSQEIKTYIGTDSIIYLNVTARSWYFNSFGDTGYRVSDFNVSYLYQPILYNGYLVFTPYGGSAANFSVSIASHNPSPLDPYLVSQESRIFGKDGQVQSALEQDLYPANYTTLLKPMISNSKEWVFLINETNVALPSQEQMPYYTISIKGTGGYTEYSYEPGSPPYYLSSPATRFTMGTENYTYYPYDYFGLFVLSDFPPSASFPFNNITGYYILQPSVGQALVMQPLNFSFTFPFPYLVRTYGNSSDPFFISYEPGNITQSFPMIYGENQTKVISPNFAGGGITGLDGNPISVDGGTSYQISLLIGNQSGGASQVWVESDSGELLFNQSLGSSTLSSSLLIPSGYTGEYTFQFPVGNTNHSVTIYLENVWGGLSIIRGVLISPESPPAPHYSPVFLSLILVIALGISYGYLFFSRRGRD